MKQHEQKLLEIAKDIIVLNSWCNAALTGSLMLKHRGIETGRDARDIDIIAEEFCGDDHPIMPYGFEFLDQKGERSELSALSFKNKEGIKVDFLYSEEPREMHDGILCGSLKCLIEAKARYAKNDPEAISEKHKYDLHKIGTL